ncbi:MAG: phosphoribosyltransferase [Desulfurococcaceae archaeon]
MAKVKTKLVTWDDILDWSWGLAEKVKASGYRPDVVVALSRGGYVPARLMCDFLGVENLISIQSQHWTEAAKAEERAIIKYPYTVDLSGQRALLVDDIVDTGDTMLLARDFILEKWRPAELRTAALQWISSVAKFRPDYYYMEVKDWWWFQYPWTRLEDTTQFIRRMMSEELKESGKREWSYSEVVSKFLEWYEIDVGERYYRGALESLVSSGFLKKIGERYVVA